MSSSVLWLALRDTPGLPRRVARQLLDRFGSPAEVFRRSASELGAYCPPGLARQLERGPDLAHARREIERAHVLGLRLLTPDDPDFPVLLLHIPDPPLAIYIRGTVPREPALAIVGARRATLRGREVARSLAAGAAEAGLCIVSGLAYGIDAAAHAGALEVRGSTVAVLASGLDRPSPQGNVRLARRILDAGGAWISEYPPGTRPLPHRFPERNRLISGLARGVLIIEARPQSGSLWTARHAVAQGRDVLVVPGPIDTDQCRGSNRLLREGAGAVLEVADLVAELLPEGSPWRSDDPLPAGLSGDATRVVRALRDGPGEADALGRSLGLDAGDLAAILLELELEGRVIREGTRVLLARRRPGPREAAGDRLSCPPPWPER